MYIAGTHGQLNQALLQITAVEASNLYGAALYVVDDHAGYAAPVASVNFVNHADIGTYQDKYHRTKLTPDIAQAASAALLRDYSPTRSKTFKDHVVSHTLIGNSPILLQRVTKDTHFTADQPTGTQTLLERFQTIHDYRRNNALSWEAIFGLKNADQEAWVCISDVNGFSKKSYEQQKFIETKLPQLAHTIANINDLKLFQIVGDEVRVRGNTATDINLYAKMLTNSFERASRAEFGTPITLKTAAAKGTISESFNGDHDNLSAVKSYKGDIFTKITAALQEMPRHKSSFTLA